MSKRKILFSTGLLNFPTMGSTQSRGPRSGKWGFGMDGTTGSVSGLMLVQRTTKAWQPCSHGGIVLASTVDLHFSTVRIEMIVCQDGFNRGRERVFQTHMPVPAVVYRNSQYPSACVGQYAPEFSCADLRKRAGMTTNFHPRVDQRGSVPFTALLLSISRRVSPLLIVRAIASNGDQPHASIEVCSQTGGVQ